LPEKRGRDSMTFRGSATLHRLVRCFLPSSLSQSICTTVRVAASADASGVSFRQPRLCQLRLKPKVDWHTGTPKMSGFEVIGVVLGAIPIVIEAYDRVAPRISAYRHYRSKVDLLVTKAMSQRTIFRNSARGLVSAINNDRQTLEDWLAEQEPQELEPSRLSCLRQGLHEDLEHCIRLVNLIHASLSSIEHEVACLDMKVRLLSPDESHWRRLGY